MSTSAGTQLAAQYARQMELDEDWLVPPVAELLSGDEFFTGSTAEVKDFWRFALGDLRMNNARGYLAEFIVATTLGLNDARRVEWDAFDILWNDITIEVKSSAYLQSWDQRRLSDIRFTGLKGTRFHARHDYDPAGKRFNAMVYVFCVQTAITHEEYRQLDVGQWAFYVLPRTALKSRGYASIGLKSIMQLSGGSISLQELPRVVTLSAVNEERDDEQW
jgi:hypothetical protein